MLLASQIAVWKTTTAPEHHQKDPTHPEVSHDMEVEDPGDMLHDAKLYQDAVIEYCNAYQALENGNTLSRHGSWKRPLEPLQLQKFKPPRNNNN